MSEIQKHDSVSYATWKSGRHPVSEIMEAFEAAVEDFDLESMQELAAQSEGLLYPYNLVKSYRLQMMRIAVPAYEQVYQLYNNFLIDEDLASRLDNMHAESLKLIDATLAQRQKSLPHVTTSQLAKNQVTEATGSISEEVVQALFNMHGRASEEVVIPSPNSADRGRINQNGESEAYDFTTYNIHDAANALKIQVKSAPHFRQKYAKDILVVSHSQLVRDEFDTRSRLELPRALASMRTGEVTAHQIALIDEASDTLHKLVKERREQTK